MMKITGILMTIDRFFFEAPKNEIFEKLPDIFYHIRPLLGIMKMCL